MPDAEALAAEDAYQFQWWALSLVVARPVEQKKGADRGIDGQLFFHDEGTHGRTKQVILSVKLGAVSVKVEGAGDIWTWTAICADTKLVPSWLVGSRDAAAANMFMQDRAGRMASRIQLTSYGQRLYLEAVEGAFGAEIDLGMLIKIYGQARDDATRYSPPECIGTQTRTIAGSPAPAHISTSYVERQNLSMRMGMRWFTRLTNGFSKKAENHAHAVALHYMHYNFGRIHKTLHVTPAMESGVTDHVWTMEEIATLMDANCAPKPRGPYKKKIHSENSN